ncbi:TRAM domain-containing protein [Candidatus Woesearchaeota archaeon]|nr:TRAM domain-containing protein [Candidatus Woesearchaeota archaeon]
MERDFRPNRSFMAPVKVGDEIDVKIEAVGEKGDGIAKKDGFVIFVPNTKEGDEVKVKVTRVLRRVGFGEVVGEGSAPSSEEAPAEAAPEAGEEPAQEEEPKAEDTEDFGEEPAQEEEKKEE